VTQVLVKQNINTALRNDHKPDKVSITEDTNMRLLLYNMLQMSYQGFLFQKQCKRTFWLFGKKSYHKNRKEEKTLYANA